MKFLKIKSLKIRVPVQLEWTSWPSVIHRLYHSTARKREKNTLTILAPDKHVTEILKGCPLRKRMHSDAPDILECPLKEGCGEKHRAWAGWGSRPLLKSLPGQRHGCLPILWLQLPSWDVQGGCPAVLAGLTWALTWEMPADLLPPSFTPRLPLFPLLLGVLIFPCVLSSTNSLVLPFFSLLTLSFSHFTLRVIILLKFPNSCPFAWQPSGRDSFFLVMLLSLRAFSRAVESLELYARFYEDALFKGNSHSSSPVLEDFMSSLSWRCPPSQMICGAPFLLLLECQGTSLYTGRCSRLYSLHSGRTGDLHQTSIKGLNYSPIIH